MSTEISANILLNDLNQDFLETVAIRLGWAYQDMQDRFLDDRTLSRAHQTEEFNKRRGDCAMRVLAEAAQKHGVPYEFRRLECNGQHKIIVTSGRVILIQEPMASLSDHPNVAEYKRELAALNAFVCQLELDLGDRPLRVPDWSGSVLAVLLHGLSGPRLKRGQKALGSLMLGLPDAAYKQWILRPNLHEIAMFGRHRTPVEPVTDVDPLVQHDNVVVTPKRRNSIRDAG